MYDIIRALEEKLMGDNFLHCWKPIDSFAMMTLIILNLTFRSTLFSSFFCSELLLSKHVEYFHLWVYPLSHELVLHSIRNPLVSGFYKLLSVTMRIAKKIKYYQVSSPSAKHCADVQI